VLADDLLGAVLLDPLGARVPRGDAALGVEEEYGVILRPLHEHSQLLRFPPGLVLLLEEIDKPCELGFQDNGRKGLDEEIDRPERVALLQQRTVAVVGGEKDDRSVP
jgi:hypothetical protein